MGIKDLFTREIEKLATMIAFLTGLLKKGETSKSLELMSDYYQEWLGTDTFGVYDMDTVTFIEMIEARKLKRPFLDAISQTLIYNGEALLAQDKKKDAASCLKKAIALLKYITTFYKEYSFDREDQVKILEAKVKDLEG